MQISYLDYFVVKHIDDYAVEIMEESIGNSDHKTLKMEIFQNEMRIQRTRNKVFCFSGINKAYAETGLELISALKDDDPVQSLVDLVLKLRTKFKPVQMKVKSHFKVIEKLHGVKDFLEMRKIITKCSKEDFKQYMSCLVELKATRKTKEYFARMRFYSELNKDVGILENMTIEDKEFGKTVSNDRQVINKAVSEKYQELFESGVMKKTYPPIGDRILYYNEGMINEALKEFNLSKATSWDLIPGKSWEQFKDNKEKLELAAKLINKILALDKVPIELALARLMCFNKNATQPGTKDALRPITIVNIITKLIEHPVKQELKKIKLNKAQTGFREKLSTELNILRLLQKTHDIKYTNYNRKGKMPKRYILFIDFTMAFDKVTFGILIKKMIAKGVREEILNVIIKLYNCSFVSTDLITIINVNSGVGQGKLCSPLEFDIFIDDLLDLLEKTCYCALAFADDTAFICESMEQLIKCIKSLEQWSEANLITVNKKKSGILILNDDGTEPSVIMGYPVVSEYKYLGILLDSKLSPKYHISALNKKLKEYLQRDKFLQKEYFTPCSLVQIVDYFVRSRLSYGLCCYLDNKAAMKMIDKTLMKHLKGIFSLPTNTSHDRLQLTLGEANVSDRLAVRLLKNWFKYKNHFDEYPETYRGVLLKYFSKEEVETEKEVDYPKLTERVVNKNLKEKALKYDIDIRDNHREVLKKYFFAYPDKRDFFLIRYFTNTTKGTNERLFPVCPCGLPNSARHCADECELILNDRRDVLEEFQEISNRNGWRVKDETSLHEMILFVFYTAKVDTAMKGDAKKAIELLKKTVTRIIIIEKKEMDDVNKEEESEQREEEKEDLASKLEDLEDIDEL